MKLTTIVILAASLAPFSALAGPYNATVYNEDDCTGEAISAAGGDVSALAYVQYGTQLPSSNRTPDSAAMKLSTAPPSTY